MSTITGRSMGATNDNYSKHRERPGHLRRESTGSLESHQQGSSSESSEMGRMGWKSVPKLNEFIIRDDLMAWKLPGSNA
jgi:hypothetical protein